MIELVDIDLLSIEKRINFVFMCVGLCIHLTVCGFVYKYALAFGAQRSSSGFIPQEPPPPLGFWSKGLPLAQKLSGRIAWMASNPRDSPVFAFQVPRFQTNISTLSFFCRYWGLNSGPHLYTISFYPQSPRNLQY